MKKDTDKLNDVAKFVMNVVTKCYEGEIPSNFMVTQNDLKEVFQYFKLGMPMQNKVLENAFQNWEETRSIAHVDWVITQQLIPIVGSLF